MKPIKQQQVISHLKRWAGHIKQWASHLKHCTCHIKRWASLIKRCISREHLWMSVPIACAVALVLLVMVKSCQGITYSRSNECKLLLLDYSLPETRVILQTLTKEQTDSLIARIGHDTLVCPVITHRYFIADKLERYLAFHNIDTTATLNDIISIVNAGADRKGYEVSTLSDTTKGYLILVNKYHHLPKDYKRQDMVPFNKTCSYKGNQAVQAVVDAFVKMQQACKKATDCMVMVSSSYRTFDEQHYSHSVYHDKLAAQPGHSEHQTGLALDITSMEHPEKWSFGKSKEGAWIRENCHKFGFVLRYPEGKSRITGYDYEPWHLRYVGIEAAQRIHDEGLTFDEYYAFYVEREAK